MRRGYPGAVRGNGCAMARARIELLAVGELRQLGPLALAGRRALDEALERAACDLERQQGVAIMSLRRPATSGRGGVLSSTKPLAPARMAS
jgi:hypothetical protein